MRLELHSDGDRYIIQCTKPYWYFWTRTYYVTYRGFGKFMCGEYWTRKKKDAFRHCSLTVAKLIMDKIGNHGKVNE